MQDPLLHNNSLPQNVTGYCPEVVPVFLEVDFYHVTMVYKGKLIFVVRVRFLMINGSKKSLIIHILYYTKQNPVLMKEIVLGRIFSWILFVLIRTSVARVILVGISTSFITFISADIMQRQSQD